MDRGENRWAQASARAATLPSACRNRTMGSLRNLRETICSGARSCDHNATYQVLRRNSMVPLLVLLTVGRSPIVAKTANARIFQEGIVRRSAKLVKSPQ